MTTTAFRVGQHLPVHEIIAHNYGADHANRIHSDEGAAKYGFAGALVPGVGLYAYLTRPALATLGREWLAHGTMSAKFIHPIYDGECARALATVSSVDPITLNLELRNAADQLCAVGSASVPATLPSVDLSNYPARELPSANEMRAPTIAAIPVGEVFGSLNFTVDLHGEVVAFLDDVVEPSPIYRGDEAVCHPAFLIARANEMLMRNVALGSWIHTASEVQQHALARDGEMLSLRGRVIETSERRGHEIVVLDLALLGESNRVLATIKHSAIVRLREPE